jgi:hypothetical protein
MESHRVVLLGGKNNRQVVSVFNNRTTVEIEVYVQRFFRCGEFKFSWWCLQELTPQECLLCFTYPYGCNEIVAIRRTLPNHEKHNHIPIPHGWRKNPRKDPTQLLDQHSIEAVERYEERHRK